MAIIRIQIDNNFTIVPNELINDPNLDWRDVGLLTFLISKIDEWQVNTEYLMSVKKSKRDAIHASFKSIIAAGYMKRRPHRVEGGKMKGWIYDLSNKPIFLNESPNTDKPNTDKPNTDKPNTDKPNSYKELNLNNTDFNNTDYSTNTETTSTGTGTILNEVQREIFVWASTHEYWHKVTYSEEEFLKVLCSPKGGMRKQFENRFKEQQTNGGKNATHQQHNKPAKLSGNEQFRAKAAAKWGNTDILEGECSPVQHVARLG